MTKQKYYDVAIDISSMYLPVKANSPEEATELVRKFISWGFIDAFGDLEIVGIGEDITEIDEEQYNETYTAKLFQDVIDRTQF